MLGQIVKSMGSSSNTSSATPCFVSAAERRVFLPSNNSSLLTSKMVTRLEFGSREMMMGWSLSLCNDREHLQMTSSGLSRELHEKSTWRVRKNICHAFGSSFSYTESGEGNVTIVEDSETIDRLLQEAGDSLVMLVVYVIAFGTLLRWWNHFCYITSLLFEVVVDISTKTCGPCRRIYPKVVQLSIEYPDVIFLKLNGDTNINTRALMKKWGIGAVPNFRFFRNGELVHSQTGAKLDVLKTHLANHYNNTIKT